MNTNLIKTSSKTINEYSCQLTDKLEYHRLEIIDNGIIKHFNKIRVINVPYALNYKVVIKRQHRKNKDKYTYQLIKPKDIKDINHINLDNIGLLNSRDCCIYDYKLETVLEKMSYKQPVIFEFTELEYDLRKLKKLLRTHNIYYTGIRQYTTNPSNDRDKKSTIKYISIRLELTVEEMNQLKTTDGFLISDNLYLETIFTNQELKHCKL